jgi:hypothetical protein
MNRTDASMGKTILASIYVRKDGICKMNEQRMIKGIPAWNFELLVNIFEDDNYWDVSLQEDMPEAYEAITSIGKKYGNIADYEDALEIYNKYEPQIIEYYGGEKAIDFIVDEFDIIPVGIIKPPKLKNKLKAKYIEGINYSTGKYYEPVSVEQQLEWDQGRFEDDGNPAGTEIPAITRSLKRALRATKLKRSSATSEVFFNTDIISQIQNGNFKSEDEMDRMDHMTIKECMEFYDKLHEPQYEELSQNEIRKLIEGESAPKFSLVSETAIPMDILIKKLMIRSGLKPITEESKSKMDRSELQRLATYLGPEYVYDEKTFKKLVKKSEKRKERQKKEYDIEYRKHKADTNRALANLLTDKSRRGRINWEDDQ